MAMIPSAPLRSGAQLMHSRIAEVSGVVTVFAYVPPIDIKEGQLVSFSEDGRVGLYDEGGNLIEVREALNAAPFAQPHESATRARAGVEKYSQ